MAECRYLLRFDDICPTMNWAGWESIEQQLVAHDLRPILAVIPDNRDPGLWLDPPVPDFWARVRRWQGMGYTIAVHGHQHVYINKRKGLMRLTPHSEFAGLPHAEQKAKLGKSLAIFAEHGVRADAFVAPSHSFDRTTLDVLVELGLTVISDGLWPWPHLDQGQLFWVPQQVWRFDPKGAGIWTVCTHHNHWTPKEAETFARDLVRHASHITDLASVLQAYGHRTLTVGDRASAFWNLMWNHRIKPPLWFLQQKLKLRPVS